MPTADTRLLPVLTLDGARRLASAGEAEARRRGWTVAIAVVDRSGDLLCFGILDNTQPGSQEVAIAKARTAARFKRPTKVLEDAAASRIGLVSLPGALLLEGGAPIVHDGTIIGAIGVSGMTSAEDGIIAAAALAAG